LAAVVALADFFFEALVLEAFFEVGIFFSRA
jgi:hypothetical protein